MPPKVVVDTLYSPERVPDSIAYEILNALGKHLERVDDALIEAMMQEEPLHVGLE